MPDRSCTMPGCGKPHRARGLRSTHYNMANTKPAIMTCAACGIDVVKDQHYSRRVVCSTTCRSYLQNGWPHSNVPPTHPSRALWCPIPLDHPRWIKTACPVPGDHPSRRPRKPRFHVGNCKECGRSFVVDSAYVSGAIHYCSMTCQRRIKKRARRAREAGASGSFTWDAFARLTLSLGNVCAYCDGDNGGQPFEPDHVVRISRGGHNGLGNILPACRACNAQKRDLLVHEWASDRELRGLSLRRYDVHRFTHLTAHDHASVAA